MIYQIQLISKATFRESAAIHTGNIVLWRDDISKDSLQVAMAGTGQLRLDQWELAYLRSIDGGYNTHQRNSALAQ